MKNSFYSFNKFSFKIGVALVDAIRLANIYVYLYIHKNERKSMKHNKGTIKR
jgi:hypothetical protein